MRSANIYNRKAAFLAWKNSSSWKFDDANQTTLPIATTDLVDGQEDYTMPSNTLSIERVEVLNAAGDGQLLRRMTKEEVMDGSLTEYYETDGLPRYWRLEGQSVLLKPAPATGSVTITAGLRIYFSRDISALTESAYRNITTEPGFHINFHPYVAFGAAVDYGVSKSYTQEKMANLRIGLMEYQRDLENYYAKRDDSYPTKIRPSVRGAL